MDGILNTWKNMKGKTLQNLYALHNLECSLEVGGDYRTYPQERSIGNRVIFRTPDGTERLSAYSQVPLLTLDGCRKPRGLWPLLSTGDEVRLAQRIAICGGARERVDVFKGNSHNRPAAVDALWRSTPVELRVAVLNEISKCESKRVATSSEKGLPPHVMGATNFAPTTLGDARLRDPNDHFQAKLDYASTTAKVDLLMGKLSKGTRKSYNTAWKHWCLFRRIQGGE